MKKMIYSMTLVLTLFLAACTNTGTLEYSPQEILNNAIQETTDLTSYYAEIKYDFGDGTIVTAKQWKKNNKIYTEVEENNSKTIALNDGNQIISYLPDEKTATVFDLSTGEEEFIMPTLKEQVMNMYEFIKDSHEITIGEDEKIAGHDTYHLIAKAKKKGTLMGDMEIWVDKKTWMPLKTISISGDMTSTTEYTKYEPNAKIEDTVFVLDFPEDVTITEETVDLPTTITLEEAKLLHNSFLVIPESTGYSIDTIEDYHVEDTNEIAINYVKNNELQFAMSIFKPLEPLTDNADEEPITVRGIQGSIFEMGTFRLLQWDENGLRYNIMIENPELSYDDILALAEQMEFVQ